MKAKNELKELNEMIERTDLGVASCKGNKERRWVCFKIG